MNTNEIAVNMEKLAIDIGYGKGRAHGILVNALINQKGEHLFMLLGDNAQVYTFNKENVAKKDIKTLSEKVQLLKDMKEAKRLNALQSAFQRLVGV